MTARQFAEKYAGQMARTKKRDRVGRVVAWKYDDYKGVEVVVIEGGPSEPPRDPAKHGGVNVVPNARSGYCYRVDEVELTVDLTRYPHKCPRCRAAAYVGLFAVECSASCQP